MPISYLLSICYHLSDPPDKVETLGLILTSYVILVKYFKLGMHEFLHLCLGDNRTCFWRGYLAYYIREHLQNIYIMPEYTAKIQWSLIMVITINVLS